MRTRIAEIETSCEESSRYLADLRESQGRKSFFSKKLKSLKDIFQWRGLSDAPLRMFSDNQESGLLYVEFPKGELEIHLKASRELLTASHEGRSWRDPDYELFLSDEYRNTFENEPQALLLFELAHRRLFDRVFQGVKERDRSLSNELARRAGRDLSTLLKRMRGEVTALGGDVAFLEILDKSPLVCLPLSQITLEDLEPELSKRGLTPTIFTVVHEFLCSKGRALIIDEVAKLVERTPLSGMSDLKLLPLDELGHLTDREMNRIISIISRKAKKSEKSLLKELMELDLADQRVRQQTRRAMEDKARSLRDIVTRRLGEEKLDGLSFQVSELITEIHRSLAGHFWHLQDYQKKRRQLERLLEENRLIAGFDIPHLREILAEEQADVSEAERLLREFYRLCISEENFSSSWEVRLAALLAAQERDLLRRPEARRTEEEDLEKLNKLKEGKNFSGNKAFDGYLGFVKEVLEPLVISGILKSLVFIWPPPIPDHLTTTRARVKDNANFTGTELIPKGRFYRFSVKGRITSEPSFEGQREKLSLILRRRLSKVATILVYDIRGFTFMSTKLRNADREKMITNKFNHVMAKIAREHGGFLLKNTGDGGILWFGANSREIYERTYKETVTGRGLRLRHSIASGADFDLKPFEDSGRRAVLCASDMVRGAEQFIRENYMLYRDWFKDVEVRELLQEGITYALLPPEFRALFRIGVGIASGEPGTDLAFGLNAFGDTDMAGTLVAQAECLSRGRDPSQSVILADGETIYNLLLNADRFDIEEEEHPEPQDLEELIPFRVAQIVRLRDSRRVYSFGQPGSSFSCVGYLLLEETDKSKSVRFDLKEDDLELDEDFKISLKNGGRAKAVYQIVPTLGEPRL